MSLQNAKVQFKYYDRSLFNALPQKEANVFYIVKEKDGNELIYRGGKLLTENYLGLDGSNYMTGPLRLSQTTQIEYDNVSESIKFVFL